jgi:hypothetical protein
VLVFYLSSPDAAITKDDISELEKELKAAGADTAAFDYVRKTREISKMTMSTNVGGTSTPTVGAVGQGGELLKGLFGNKVRGILGLAVHETAHSFLVHRPITRWRSRKSHFRREKFPPCEQASPHHSTNRSTYGFVLGVQSVFTRN